VSRKDVIKNLANTLQDQCLKSSARLLILISLSINKKLGFTEILELTGLGKGSLSNHIQKLEESGYIRTRKVTVFGGRRLIVEITEKGLSAYNDYLNLLRSIVLNQDRSPTKEDATESFL
jgi:DNA-binding MarR family transcriptional regulator